MPVAVQVVAYKRVAGLVQAQVVVAARTQVVVAADKRVAGLIQALVQAAAAVQVVIADKRVAGLVQALVAVQIAVKLQHLFSVGQKECLVLNNTDC